MNLQDFVSETLVQIIKGITAAQEEIVDTTAKVSPIVQETAAYKNYTGLVPVQGNPPASMVAFDVALTATEGTGTKGGIGVMAGVLSLGSTGQSSNENTSVSRVQFSVPVILPYNS